jgi:hypothetical protein
MTVASLKVLAAQKYLNSQDTPQSVSPHKLPQNCIDIIQIMQKLNSLKYQPNIALLRAFTAIDISNNNKVNFSINSEIAVFYFMKVINQIPVEQKIIYLRSVLKNCILKNNIFALKKFIELIKNDSELSLKSVLITKHSGFVLENLLYFAAKNGSMEILNFLYKTDPDIILLSTDLFHRNPKNPNQIFPHSAYKNDPTINFPPSDSKINILSEAIRSSETNKFCPFNIRNIEFLIVLYPHFIYATACHDAIINKNPPALNALLKKKPSLINNVDCFNLNILDLCSIYSLDSETNRTIIKIIYSFRHHFTSSEKRSLIRTLYREINPTLKGEKRYDRPLDAELDQTQSLMHKPKTKIEKEKEKVYFA